ncbi:MAG: ribonuclease J [Candidatus Obscuribacterales bacterium]|nr:ribonuclease J [Candidatus Obscuribacterales bacterium]
MSITASGSTNIQYDSLTVVPLGGQSELGQLLWVIIYGGEILLVDAGAAYPYEKLPGVDLLLPNTNFLEANQDKIIALLLTNGHEEHSGAVSYLLRHLDVPKIMAPRFVCQLLSSAVVGAGEAREGIELADRLDSIESGRTYEIGNFEVEWLPVNNAIADACALRVASPVGQIVYTSSFKLDQSPVDKRFLDVGGFSKAGDKGVLLLISDSAGVEYRGYTPSEASISQALEKHVLNASGRVFIVFPGTNTHRLQIFFDVAARTGRKVVLVGEPLLKTALAAAVTGNLNYDRALEATIEQLKNIACENVMIIASGIEDDPLNVLYDIAYGYNPEVTLVDGDTLIYSSHVMPGKLRFMAMILDQLLALGVKAVHGFDQGVNVSKHASTEELKLMLTMVKPKYFIPAIGEARHIMHHSQLAIDWGIEPDNVFPLSNGEILELKNGIASLTGSIEAEPVLYNREQGERVSTASVKERRVLSLEGVVTVALVVDPDFRIIAGPNISAGASGFLRSGEWREACISLKEAIMQTVEKVGKDNGIESNTIRSAIRDICVKTLRGRLNAKPTVQVVLHEVATSRPR